MDQKEWLEYELRTIQKDHPRNLLEVEYRNGYQDALTNALNNLSGMTPNTPDFSETE